MQNFPPMYPGENRTVTIGFTNELASGETINAGPAVAVTVESGADPNPDAIKIGAPTVSTPNVLQRVNPLIDGVDYRIKATIVTSLGNTIIGEGLLPVRAKQ